MKKVSLKTGIVLFCIFSANAALAAPVAKISCSLNKSESVVLELERNDRGAYSGVLTEQNFLGDTSTVALLDRPNVIHYGNVLIVTQNNGRSGYVFLRFEKNDEGRIQAWMDINLFLNTNTANTHGGLAKRYCTGEF